MMAGWTLTAGFGEESSATPIQVAGRILLLVVVGLRSHFLDGYPFGVPLHIGPCSPSEPWGVQTFLCLASLVLPLLPSFSAPHSRKLSAFKDSDAKIRSTWIIQGLCCLKVYNLNYICKVNIITKYFVMRHDIITNSKEEALDIFGAWSSVCSSEFDF